MEREGCKGGDGGEGSKGEWWTGEDRSKGGDREERMGIREEMKGKKWEWGSEGRERKEERVGKRKKGQKQGIGGSQEDIT